VSCNALNSVSICLSPRSLWDTPRPPRPVFGLCSVPSDVALPVLVVFLMGCCSYTTPIKALSNQKYREFYEVLLPTSSMNRSRRSCCFADLCRRWSDDRRRHYQQRRFLSGDDNGGKPTTCFPFVFCLQWCSAHHSSLSLQILRSMLYRGSDLLRSLRWVVFDEVHYMRDKVRYPFSIFLQVFSRR
jgi:hypothetical protein